MTARQHWTYTISCDAPSCGSITVSADDVPRARARRSLLKYGWTQVRSPLGYKHDRDFCPDHKPADGAS